MCYTDKKENKIFLKYKEIQNEAIAKSYIQKYKIQKTLGRAAEFF